MEELNSNQSKIQKILQAFRESLFKLMLLLIKGRKIGIYLASIMIVITFIQIYGFLWDEHSHFDWHDDFLLDAFQTICNIFRVFPLISENKSGHISYWVLYSICIFIIFSSIVLIIYAHFSINAKKFYFQWPIDLLRLLFILIQYIFYCPLLETLLSLFHCNSSKSFTYDTSIECYGGLHIFLMSFSAFLAIVLYVMTIFISLLFNESNLNPEDALAREDKLLEILLLSYRTLAVVIISFFYDSISSYIFLLYFTIGSILFCYRYCRKITFYNKTVSVVYGSSVFCYTWICINAAFMMLCNIYGHMIIISIGIPIISGVVANYRERKIQSIKLASLEKVKNDGEAILHLLQIEQMVTEFSTTEIISRSGNNSDLNNASTGGSRKESKQVITILEKNDITLIGLINLHVIECTDEECPCKNPADLYDVKLGKFSERNCGFHKDAIFLKHINSKLFEIAISTFSGSIDLRIAYAWYLLNKMTNVHAALTEINFANKMKPSFQQQFAIYKCNSRIEDLLATQDQDSQDIYSKLTSVIEFEILLSECQKFIEQTSNFQIEFWGQLSNSLPDLNILNELSKKIYDSSEKASALWKKIMAINNNFSKALSLYGNYLIDIKHSLQAGYELLEQVKGQANKKSLDELTKTAGILFMEDTAIIHVSGAKEPPIGKILKTNMGLTKLFGFSKTEVIGHSINLLMPDIFAKRHEEFMEKFFKIGYQQMFNRETLLFGVRRNRNCFYMKMVIKQMPNLSEGIQYVGMIRQMNEDYEYILTDSRGVINSMTPKVSAVLGLNGRQLQEDEINIQILAPDLMPLYLKGHKMHKVESAKFKEIGGKKIQLIVPKDFELHVQAEDVKKNRHRKNKHNFENASNDIKKENNEAKQNRDRRNSVSQSPRSGLPLYKIYNKDLNKKSGGKLEHMSRKKLIESKEYKESEIKQHVKCEVTDLIYGERYKDVETLEVKVLKLTGVHTKYELEEYGEEGLDMGGGSASQYSFARKQSMLAFDFHQKFEKTEDEKKNLMDLISRNKACDASPKSLFYNKSQASPKHKKQEQAQQHREETITTEKLSKNLALTSEGRVETAKADPISGNVVITETNKEEQKDIHAIEGEKKEEEKTPPVENVKPQLAEQDTPKRDLCLLTSPEAAVCFRSQLADKSSEKRQSESDSSKGIGNEGVNQGSLIGASYMKASVAGKQKGLKSHHFSATQITSLMNIISEPGLLKQKKRKIVGTIVDEGQSLPQPKLDQSKADENYSSKADLNEENIEEPHEGDNYKIPEKKEEKKLVNIHVSSILDNIIQGPNTNKEESKGDAENQKQIDLKPPDGGAIPETLPKSLPMDKIEPLKNEPEKKKEMVAKQPVPNQRRKVGIKKKIQYMQILDSADYQGMDAIPPQEYHLGDEEIKLRKAFKLYDKKLRKKDRKKVEKLGGVEIKKENKPEEEEHDKSKKKLSKEEKAKLKEEKKDELLIGTTPPINEDDDEDNQEAQSSITSGSTGSSVRMSYSLRAAIDEKFIPKSIKNLQIGADILFLLLLSLAITFFALQNSLYSSLSSSIKNIRYSEDRLNVLLDISLKVRELSFLSLDSQLHLQDPQLLDSAGLIRLSKENKLDKYVKLRNELIGLSSELKRAQTIISQEAAAISLNTFNKVNPHNFILSSLPIPMMPETYLYSMDQAIMETVVSGFHISNLSYSNILPKDASVYFIEKNTLNNILINLESSTSAVVDDNHSMRRSTEKIFLILLCLASGFLALATALLIPVVNNNKRDKQELFELFMHIKKRDIDTEIQKCRKFLTSFQVGNETEVAASQDIIEEQVENPGENNQQQQGVDKLRQMQGRIRKHKDVIINIGFLLFKFIFCILLIEGYYILSYFFAYTFLNQLNALTQELYLLIERVPTYTLLLLGQQIAIYFNYNVKIKNNDSSAFLENLHNTLYTQEEKLLDEYQSNYDYHSNTYNAKFNDIVFDNICQKLTEFSSNMASCERFNQGILKKGLYASVIKYWDAFRQLNHDFYESARTPREIYNFLNDDRLLNAEYLRENYINLCVSKLVVLLENDINWYFDKELSKDKLLFAIFILLLFLFYTFFWRVFLNGVQDDLWKTKSILGVIPPDLVVNIPEIKNFILRNSSTVFIARGGQV